MLVVVSHFCERPTDDLHRLLTQLDAQDPGSIDVVVVVNTTTGAPIALPRLHREVPVLYRENTGMNIGGWDHGWRSFRGHDHYVFLQDECVVLDAGWPDAYRATLDDPGVGLIGERMHNGRPWDEAVVDNWRMMHYRRVLEGWGVPLGDSTQHVQSLVWVLRKDVLEAVDGFFIGKAKHDCVAAEIALSRQVAARGLDVRLAHRHHRRLSYISHIQWDERARAVAARLAGQQPA